MERASSNYLKEGCKMSIKNVLVDEFESEIKVVKTMEVGSEKYKIAVDGVTKIADRIIELEKIKADCDEKERNREVDEYFKSQQLKYEKRDRLVNNCLKGISIIGGMGVTAWAAVASMNFEKEGTFTTEAGRNAIRQLLKFKF